MKEQLYIENKRNIICEWHISNQDALLSLSNLVIYESFEFVVYTIFDSNNTLQAFALYSQTEIDEQTNSWNKLGFNKIVRIKNDFSFELMPISFYDGEKKALAKNTFVVPTNFIHWVEVVCAYYLKKINNEQVLCLSSMENKISMIIMKNELLLANTFTCNSDEEVLYNILNGLQQCQLKAENTGIKLDYSVQKTSSLYSILKQYFASIHIMEYPNEIALDIPDINAKLFIPYAYQQCE